MENQIIGPLGDFGWTSLPASELSNPLHNLPLEKIICSNPGIGRQYRLVNVSLGAGGIACMLAHEVITLSKDVSDYFTRLGVDESISKYELFPLLKIENFQKILTSLSPRTFYLYSYLSGLTRKKNFSIANTPKAIGRWYHESHLLDSYQELTTIGLLIESDHLSWHHKDDAVSKLCRDEINLLTRVGEFIKEICNLDKHWKIAFSKAREYNFKLISHPPLWSKNNMPNCPICQNTPGGAQIDPELEWFRPFHYRCMPPFVVSDDSLPDFLKGIDNLRQ